MTREETKKILYAIQALYPNYRPENKSAAVDVWCMTLSEYDYQAVSIALKMYAQTDQTGFAPAPGQLIANIYAKSEHESITATDAWGMVTRAMRNSAYHAEEEFDKLPKIVQRAVGSPTVLREWGTRENIDGNTMSVTQAGFTRIFNEESRKQSERARTSPDVLELLGVCEENILPQPQKYMIEQKTEFEEDYFEGAVQIPERVKEKYAEMLEKLRGDSK